MAKYDGIILDIDGTIWNTTEIVAEAWNKAIEECGFTEILHVTAAILQQEFGKTMAVIADDLWPELNPEQRAMLLKESCRHEHAALKKNTKDIAYEGVVQTVKKLGGKVNFYIVSNCQNGYIELTMKKNGLTPYIKDFECYGRTGKGKADNIRLLAERNGLKAPVYVGDTLGDQQACKEAGVAFFWASYGFGQCDDYAAKLEQFSDIEKFI